MEILKIAQLNINDYVRVHLTEYGEKILKKYNYVAFQYNYNERTKILETELWTIMNTFGPYFSMGNNDMLFVNNQITIIEGL